MKSHVSVQKGAMDINEIIPQPGFTPEEYAHHLTSLCKKRFSLTNEDGIYLAHQPIYGFRAGHCEERVINRYTICYRMLKALSRLEFDSLLDVGSAEGYKPFLVKELLGEKSVTCVDVVEEACQRVKDLFGFSAIPAQIHDLPFDDNSFDVVLCSETIEHVPDPKRSVEELLRVAKKAVIITVPHDPPQDVEDNVKNRRVLAHINAFDVNSFNYLEQKGIKVIREKSLSPLLKLPRALTEGTPRTKAQDSHFPNWAFTLFNRCQKLLNKLFGKRSVAVVIRLDEPLCSLAPYYLDCQFTLLKDPTAYRPDIAKPISIREMISCKVPLLVLKPSQ